MLKLIVLLMLVIPTIYNYILQRENKVRVKMSPILGFALVIFTIVISFIWYRVDTTPLGFFILPVAVLLSYTISFFPGISENGINVLMGSTPILKFISVNQIKSVGLKEDDSSLELKVKAFGNTYKQIYDIKNKEKIINILYEHNLIRGDL